MAKNSIRTLLWFDELNKFTDSLSGFSNPFPDGETTKEKKDIRDYSMWCHDSILDLLIMAYVFGCEEANDELGTKVEIDETEMRETIFRVVEGKTFEDRISEYIENQDIDGIVKVVTTEGHNAINSGSHKTATKAGAKSKTWVTMQDLKVRDTHDYLDGVTIPIDAEFITYNGDKAQHPGGFGEPEEDINCRCWLEYK